METTIEYLGLRDVTPNSGESYGIEFGKWNGKGGFVVVYGESCLI